MISDSLERRQGKSPAYFVSNFGVLKEAEWDEDNPPAGHYPLYWRKRPLPKERLKELFEQAEGKLMTFIRLVEKEHGIT